MNLADSMSRLTTILSYIGIFLLALNLPLILSGTVVVPWLLIGLLMLAPTLLSLMQLALSRAREYTTPTLRPPACPVTHRPWPPHWSSLNAARAVFGKISCVPAVACRNPPFCAATHRPGSASAGFRN